MSLTFDEKNIHLKIEDNGIGFNKGEIKHRGGLDNMQHRAEEIKGVIKINSVIERGGDRINFSEVMLNKYFLSKSGYQLLVKKLK